MIRLFLFHVLLVCVTYSKELSLVNNKVDRTIDISSQLVKVFSKLLLENVGRSPVSTFHFALQAASEPHLSILIPSVPEDGKTHLKYKKISSDHKDAVLYEISLKNPLQPGKTVAVEVETVFTHSLVPHPSHITQSEKQMVVYNGNHYFYSPYSTRTQTTAVTLPSSSIESYSKLKPVSHNDNTISYGPYENIPAFSESKMTVHYENNNPFLTVSRLERAIEVSHWGVISIEEVIDIVHTGAVLKGPFSRYEFQRDQSGISAIKAFKTVLPASAADVYYRDEIGNISTSHLRELDDSVEVELRPRFPLFGGWKTHYVLGYTVPTYEYLYNNGDHYVLKIRFVDHIFDDSVIDHATVRVILPEGTKNIQVKLPYEAVKKPDELHFTYLDTVGRPVVIFDKNNLVEQHIQDFEVHYEFQKILMLQEPILVVVALYFLFLLVIIYVRLDFTITRDPVKESKLRISGLTELVHNHHDKRTDVYTRFDEALNKFKHHKDLASYQALVKRLNMDHKVQSQAINELLSKLKHEQSETADKVSELQRLDKNLKEQLLQQQVLVEKLIANKVNKQQYVDSEAAINRKKEGLVEKMQSVLSAL